MPRTLVGSELAAWLDVRLRRLVRGRLKLELLLEILDLSLEPLVLSLEPLVLIHEVAAREELDPARVT